MLLKEEQAPLELFQYCQTHLPVLVHPSMGALLPVQPSGGARKTLKDTFKLCGALDPSWCKILMHIRESPFLELSQYCQTHSPVPVNPSMATLLPVQPSALLQSQSSMTARSAYLYAMQFEHWTRLATSVHSEKGAKCALCRRSSSMVHLCMHAWLCLRIYCCSEMHACDLPAWGA